MFKWYLIVQTVFEDFDVMDVSEVGAHFAKLLTIFGLLEQTKILKNKNWNLINFTRNKFNSKCDATFKVLTWEYFLCVFRKKKAEVTTFQIYLMASSELNLTNKIKLHFVSRILKLLTSILANLTISSVDTYFKRWHSAHI